MATKLNIGDQVIYIGKIDLLKGRKGKIIDLINFYPSGIPKTNEPNFANVEFEDGEIYSCVIECLEAIK